jgi:uncharacterized membrane protein YcaP (DUF421 family)
METLEKIFGHGDHLSILQMSCRGILAFVIAFGLIRISGRRSFGLRTPLDNIISILLGAILSRAVVGASPFAPVFSACLAIVLLHRGCSFLISRSKTLGRFFEGRKILLFENGEFISEAMRKALVCEEDILQGVRKSALTDDLSKIDRIYMERNGDISAIKK